MESQNSSDSKFDLLKLDLPHVIIDTIAIVTGSFFSILCLVTYFRQSSLRTHFTYVFIFMLIYCLLSATIRAPVYLIGYYLGAFQYSISLCYVSIIHYLTIGNGMVTSLAYASIERHFLMFRKNGLLTWQRQLVPVSCILVYSYCTAILFTFIPSCSYVPCIACYTTQLTYMILWLLLSFFIPQSLMLVSTAYLLYRLYRHRKLFNQKSEWPLFKQIVLQMSIYVFWSCLCYGPVSFYNLSMIIRPSKFSPNLKIALDISNTIILQMYPLLTFTLMLLFERRRQAGQRKPSNPK